MLSLQTLIKDDKLAQDVQALYLFFTEAETAGTHFTYAKIRDHFPRSPSNISKYVRNYWSWFLHREPEKQGRANTFSCHGLKEYPLFYFVMAHQRNQGQYYRHFSEALLKAKERDQARRAKLQETTEVPPSPNVPGQQPPEELHIEELPPDEEVEEDELEQPQDQEDYDETAGEPARKERINFMSIFTLDKQLAEVRAEFTQKLEALEQRLIREIQQLGEAQQSHVPPEVSQVLKELGQLQEQVRAFSEQVQTAERAIVEEVQQSGTSFSQIREEVARQAQTLTEEIQRSRASVELSQIAEKLEQMQKQAQEISSSLSGQLLPLSELSVTSTNLEQLQTKVDELVSQQSHVPLSAQLSALHEQVDRLREQFPSPSGLEQLQGQVDGLSSQISSALEKLDGLQEGIGGIPLSSVLPISEQRSLDTQMDKRIRETVQDIVKNINILGQDLAGWIDQHYFAVHQDQLALREDMHSFVDQRFAGQSARIPQTYKIQEDTSPEKQRLIGEKSETQE